MFKGIAKIFSKQNTTNGYLKFIPKEVLNNNIFDCEYFFFNNSKPFETKRIKQKLEVARNIITEKIENIEKQIQMSIAQAEQKKAQELAAIQAEQMRQMVKEVTEQQKLDTF